MIQYLRTSARSMLCEGLSRLPQVLLRRQRKATTTIRLENPVVKEHRVQQHNQKQIHLDHYLLPQTRERNRFTGDLIMKITQQIQKTSTNEEIDLTVVDT